MIIKDEGAMALYKGMSAAALREMSYSSLRFGLYEPFKRILGETDPKTTPVWKKFAAGAAAGIIGSGIANPTDVLKVRMQAHEGGKLTIMGVARDVYSDGGLRSFYRGVHTTMIRAAILNATKLAAYDEVKHKCINNGIMVDGTGLHFVASMVAGVAVATTTSPVDIVRTRLFNQPKGVKIYSGMMDCAMKTYTEGGVAAFYRGFTPQWMRFGPFTIIQFMVWEKLRAMYGMKGI
mmetsp:Transcript_21077/g.47545  ORF Transcript_21077/g.47545 Transcript_21077/m.47545 type:complete len:235 (+) Transcript_21077:1-705(+)